ncbi:hypothetical protein K8O92_19290 [Nocardia asteroides]|nr:hypothetical protein K8O92_19290 [Nocardia asteroides]
MTWSALIDVVVVPTNGTGATNRSVARPGAAVGPPHPTEATGSCEGACPSARVGAAPENTAAATAAATATAQATRR